MSSGLQLADLVARPIGLHTLKPEQPNRSFDIYDIIATLFAFCIILIAHRVNGVRAK